MRPIGDLFWGVALRKVFLGVIVKLRCEGGLDVSWIRSWEGGMRAESILRTESVRDWILTGRVALAEASPTRDTLPSFRPGRDRGWPDRPTRPAAVALVFRECSTSIGPA